jgi:hypothetical protein
VSPYVGYASNSAVRAQYEYDPYGNRTKISGDLDASFGFTGRWHHATSGLNLALITISVETG